MQIAAWKFFIREWLRQPLKVAAIAPSSPSLARMMAAQISSPNPMVLELGPGTGPLTRGILESGVPPERLVLVERSLNMVEFLRAQNPALQIFHGDAGELDTLLDQDQIGHFTDVVSGLPLLSMRRETRREILQQAFAVMAPGGRFIQFSYGLIPPLDPEHLNLKVRLAGRVWENLPPATVWVYEKP